MRHIILISGKDSTATAIIQKQRNPDLHYEYLFNDTGAELPETYTWLDRVSAYLQAPITRVGANLENIIAGYGILPSSRVRFCTREAKIEPMETYLAGDPATVYFGLRADEPQRVGYVPRKRSKNAVPVDITPAYPLRDAGMTIMDVWNVLDSIDLLPPLFFWQSMYNRVVQMLGNDVALLDCLTKPEFHQLFAWRSRPNCYFCFFQRQYEFIGLLEHHPDLFWQAVELEETTGAEGFTLQQSHSLRSLIPRADQITHDRAASIIKFLGRRANLSMFEADYLTPTSCGLLCGK